jgi:hypothetical protein
MALAKVRKYGLKTDKKPARHTLILYIPYTPNAMPLNGLKTHLKSMESA